MLTINCPQCDTALKLDPAAIRVSQGWARCGQCQTVFDAGQLSLPTLDPHAANHDQANPPTTGNTPSDEHRVTQMAPPQTSANEDNQGQPLQSHSNARAPTESREDHSDSPIDVLEPSPDHSLDPDAQLPFDVSDAHEITSHPEDVSDASLARSASGAVVAPEHDTERRDAPLEPVWLMDDTSTIAPAPPEPHWVEQTDTPSADDKAPQAHSLSNHPAEEASPLPITSLDAHVASSGVWPQPRRSSSRVLWVLMLIALVVLLLGQLFRWQHDWLAARWPRWQPLVVQACQIAGCDVQNLHDVRQLQIVHSAVVRLHNNQFQMDLELRNNGLTQVATPRLELTLQDAEGHAWARRILNLEIQDKPQILLAGQHLQAAAYWQTSAEDASRVQAYQVRLVYTSSETTQATSSDQLFRVKL